jgi:magnesium transporter
MAIEINDEFIRHLEMLIEKKDDHAIIELLAEEHTADIAEIIDELEFDDTTYLFKLLDSEKTAEVLLELDEYDRAKILEILSAKEIAQKIDEMDTDDAADILGELSVERKSKVLSKIEDEEHARDIADLLQYHEDTAGGLMAKELVKVNENWTVPTCVRKMRSQAQEVTRVHSIYVVDDNNVLKGRLSLKDLLVAPASAIISDVAIPKVDFVNVNEKSDEVARIMQKYDLDAIPVVDDDMRLLGRITIDDILDVITEEADKDYQLAAGLTDDVEADDSLFDLTRARLPWLVLGLFGGLTSASIIGGFDSALNLYPQLFFYTPLIGAMAGNVGVQSSAIIVQGLARDNLRGTTFQRLMKEIGLSLINGIILATLVFAMGFIVNQDIKISFTIASSLIIVIIISSLVGTFVPLLLEKKGIDPAVATGPFITTSNDIFGILIYFSIAKIILGF